ncbi:tyrosine-type recombinase/integrase [Catenulispora sp. NL8]|uniref:Tyrosine-type recombinase/integrase n=1 Tax=Catenulispora pinistramenti TaxID=2705254 RepID=A0ABS5KJ44_9ACTN|nr:tyrosine-type recombinase/integrase [Catenulispora pinistramenti]MBS2545351.1 tyrosine-type recombinase/integrase [Catenulispora pinistramenti]
MTKRDIPSWPTPRRSGSATSTYFDTVVSAPTSQPVEERELTWYQHAIAFNDMKWPFLQCGSRRSYAECLATVTAGIVTSEVGAPNPRTLFRALASWSFNKTAREAGPPPSMYTDAITWIEQRSRPLTDLLDPRIARAAFATTLTTLDGRPYSTKARRNKRSVLVSALNYAVELELLDRNPMDRIKDAMTWRAAGVDRRSVVNPDQARALLDAVAAQGLPGKRLVAFFATMYFAALRPSEILALRIDDCLLPESGWGWLTLDGATPYTGPAWTDNATGHQRKSLKHRVDGDERHVPAHPELVRHLHAHIAAFGITDDGRLFRNTRDLPYTYASYNKVWHAARNVALTPPQVRSPLGRRPYDLRHAAVSTWLNAGVAAAQVAVWAGHSVKMLLDVYAKCLDGQEEAAMALIETRLGPAGT